MISTFKTFPSIDQKQTGKKIEMLRKNHGISVHDLQQCFGFEYPQAIYNWQHGTCLPSIDNLVVLACIFHVSIDDLLVVDQGVFSCPDVKPDHLFSGRNDDTAFSDRLVRILHFNNHFIRSVFR